jgi:hypothetical protein
MEFPVEELQNSAIGFVSPSSASGARFDNYQDLCTRKLFSLQSRAKIWRAQKIISDFFLTMILS